MNILDFERWDKINEGIDTNISSDDKDSKDEITIDDTTYTIKKNKVYTNNGEISDNKLKIDIKNANRAVGDLKETEERFEELRLTGGEDTDIVDEILDIINKDEYKKSDESLFDTIEKTCSNFFNQSGKTAYINIPDLNVIFNNKEIAGKVKNIFGRYETGIGKGEYFLPLLYKDVHKKKPYGTDPYTKKRVKGDNYILNGEKIYDLELKSPYATLGFKKKKPTKDTDIENLKNIITSRFLEYVKKENENGAYIMCIFEADELTENDNKIFNPKGMLFINISNLKEESTLFDEIKKLINIVFDTTPQTYKVSKDQFKFVLTSDDGNNPKLNCIVHGSYKNINNESLLQILSRDNFINEIYTK